MAGIDGKIVDTAEKMARSLYHLQEDYNVSSYTVKSSVVEITLSNHLITLKIKFPTPLIEEHLDYYADCEEEEEEEVLTPEVITKTVRKAPLKR